MAQAAAHSNLKLTPASEQNKSNPNFTRRNATGALIATAAATIAPMAAIAASPADADLIALGKKYEPLLRQFLDAHVVWAPLLNGAHRRASELSGVDPFGEGYERIPTDVRDRHWEVLDKICAESAHRESDAHLSALHALMDPLEDAILEADAKTLAGLRAKALVFLKEARPCTCSESDLVFNTETERSLFYAVADFTGITAMADEFEAKLTAALRSQGSAEHV